MSTTHFQVFSHSLLKVKTPGRAAVWPFFGDRASTLSSGPVASPVLGRGRILLSEKGQMNAK